MSWMRAVMAGAVAAPAPGVPTTGIAFPLTYDETDSLGLTWARQGAGPHVTPMGFAGNGYSSRYLATSGLPSFITAGTAGPLLLHATVHLDQCRPRRTGISPPRDIIVSVGNNDATAQPKLGLSVVPDEQDDTLPHLALRTTTDIVRTRYLARKNWRFNFKFPQITEGGETVRPQGILFLDADTVLVQGNYNDTLCRVYKVLVETGVVLGYFDFASPRVHGACISKRESDGTYWFSEFATFELLRVDLDASFASNVAVVTLAYDMSAITGFGSIEWIDDGTNEYLLAGEYATTGSPYVYVVDPADIVDLGAFVVADRVKRFVLSQTVQGITLHDGLLYASMNRYTGESPNVGRVKSFDIWDAITNLADGGTLTPIDTWNAPSQYVEDIDFHPTTGFLWMQTEGRASVADNASFLSAWDSDLTADAMVNHVTLWYPGTSDTIAVRLNNRDFGVFVIPGGNLSVTPAAVTVGGPPSETGGQGDGFFLGYVRNIVIQDYDLTNADYELAISGSYEPSTLVEYSVTITNPGGESTTTGWTSETGTLGNRATNPDPHSGSSYFNGGSFARTTARQRFGIGAVTGLSDGAIDAAVMWGRVTWFQAGFNTGTDTCTMGLRYLNGTPTLISLTQGPFINQLPTLEWTQGCLPVLVPSGARNVDIVYDAIRSSGTNNDGYVDDITLTFYKQ